MKKYTNTQLQLITSKISKELNDLLEPLKQRLISEYVFTVEEEENIRLINELIKVNLDIDALYAKRASLNTLLKERKCTAYSSVSVQFYKDGVILKNVINPLIDPYKVSSQDLEYKILTSGDDNLGTLIQSIKDEFIKKLETI
jgi:hypothetical protein